MGTLSYGRCFDLAADAQADWASRQADPAASAALSLPSCTASTVQSPYDLSYADAAQVSAAIASVWIAAAIWRWLKQSLNDRGDD